MGWIVVGVLFAASFAYTYWASSKASQNAQKPGEVPNPTASEGIPIPVVFGTRQVTDPNTCWFGDLGTEKDGNSYKYYAGMQHAICHGKLDSIRRVFIAEKASQQGLSDGVMNQTIAPERDLSDPYKNGANDFVSGLVQANYGAANTAGTVDDGTPLYPGTDDYLAKQMGVTGDPFKGPRYYGIATVTAKHCWLGNSPYLKPWGFLVTRIHTRNAGRATQWYDAKAEITVGRTFDGLWKYKLRSIADEVSEDEYAGVSYDDSAWPSAPGGIGNAPRNQYMGDWNSFNQSTMDYPVPPVTTQLEPDGTIIKGVYPHNWVQDLARLWLRADLGAMPEYQLNVRCHHDDAARLWFNGTEITITPMKSATSAKYEYFNSSAVIPASLINPAGPNVVAYKVINGLASFGASAFIYGSITIGVDASSESAIVADMNPAHIIRECITDTIWGMGWPESLIYDTSFTAAADTLYSEGFGLSLEWNRQGEIKDFLDEVLRTIGGNLIINRASGKWMLKLVRDDYDAETILSLGEADIAKVENATRREPGEIVNSVAVTYSATARGDKGTVGPLYDEGLFQAQDGTIAQTIDYPGVRNPATASRLCLRDLRMLSSSLFSCSLECSRKAATLQIGDPFILNWPDLYVVDMICRVTSIDIGNAIDGTVKIDCVEDVFSYPQHPVTVPNTPIVKDQPPSTIPIDLEQYQTALCIDERNKGSVTCVFNGSAFGVGGGVFANWTEESPGVMVRNTAGPLTADMFDGIDPFTGTVGGGGYTTGQLQYIGKRVFALSGSGDLPGNGQQFQGVYVIDDLGWDGVSSTTYARMHRDPSFSTSGQFAQYMIFQARSGTTYGGHYFQLATANVVLGTTEQSWTHIVPAALTWNDTYKLLRSDQLASVAVSPDASVQISASSGTGSSDFGEKFRTLVGTPGTDAIPAGPWRFTFGPVKVTGSSVGSTTTLGLKVCKNSDLSKLFEIQTEALTEGEWKIPGSILTQLPQYLISKDQLALVPTVNTDSSSAVTVTLFYNMTYAIKVSMPKGTNTIGPTSPDEDWFDVTIVGGLISGFGDHRRLRVHGAGPLQAISIGGLGSAANLLLHFVADTVISANDAVTGGAGIITSKDGETEYQDRFYPADTFISMALIASGTVIYWKTA